MLALGVCQLRWSKDGRAQPGVQFLRRDLLICGPEMRGGDGAPKIWVFEMDWAEVDRGM